ncbi:hypothetical protein [Vibrio artabrorum]|uniref:hypothetical protein n=1 Tax=Vibrio artabrorum TaxID=446374 RepID=UPI0021C2F8A2|nr:hypothetical protein [Vibrio artabrorum]
MKTLSILTIIVRAGIKIIIFLLIEVISLAYIFFRVIGALVKIVVYGVKLSVVKQQHKNSNQ